MSQHVHLIGIGGTGLSAIARVLIESGYTVSGSDRALSPLAQGLIAAGAQVTIGHRAENVAGADLVVRSSAIPDDNPEVQAARAAGIPVLKRYDFLGRLMAGHTGLAVAGTHGKTTITGMIAWMLTALGQDPSYIVGSVVKNLGSNAHAGRGRAFVIEADEYDRMFLGLEPDVIVVTSVEHDHPDFFPTAEIYHAAFAEFVARLRPGGLLLACADNPGAAALLDPARAQGRRALAYGLSAGADFRAAALAVNAAGGYSFDVVAGGPPARLARAELAVPGEHNVANALAALAVARELGLSVADAARALGDYQGTTRRFDVRGEAGGVTIIDDYAHHPTEIRATLAAARARFPGRRLWAVWQPHTYTRTQALLPQFAAAFDDADRVLVTEVYAAREAPQPFSAADVVRSMRHPDAHFVSELAAVVEALIDGIRPGDVVLVFSAGDADRVSADLLRGLAERTAPHG